MLADMEYSRMLKPTQVLQQKSLINGYSPPFRRVLRRKTSQPSIFFGRLQVGFCLEGAAWAVKHYHKVMGDACKPFPSLL